MIRPTWTCVAVAMLAMAAGCRMCATSPHDYSGPVLDGSCGGACGHGGRAGSILSGPPPAVVQGDVQPDPAYQPSQSPDPAYQTRQQPQPAAVPAQPGGPNLHPEFGVDPRMILSVTDRKVEAETEAAPE